MRCRARSAGALICGMQGLAPVQPYSGRPALCRAHPAPGTSPWEAQCYAVQPLFALFGRTEARRGRLHRRPASTTGASASARESAAQASSTVLCFSMVRLLFAANLCLAPPPGARLLLQLASIVFNEVYYEPRRGARWKFSIVPHGRKAERAHWVCAWGWGVTCPPNYAVFNSEVVGGSCAWPAPMPRGKNRVKLLRYMWVLCGACAAFCGACRAGGATVSVRIGGCGGCMLVSGGLGWV